MEIAFISHLNSTFIRNDVKILQAKHNVRLIKHKYNSSLKLFLSVITVGWKLFRSIRETDLVYIWFADYHALIPTLIAKIFKTPSVVVIGGYDSAKIEELEYGGHTNAMRSWVIKRVCKNASRILPVSFFTEALLKKNTSVLLEDKSSVIYNGVDPKTFHCSKVIRKKQVITICGAEKTKVLFIKGIDFFCSVAKQMPNVSFIIIGLKDAAYDQVNEWKSPNVEIIKYVKNEELKHILCTSTVICQFSRIEAFGVALVEGMLCGCIPVGHQYGGIAEIINTECGYFISELNVNMAKNVILKALKSNHMSSLAKLRVLNEFTLEKRKKAILDCIDKILK